MVKVKRAKSKPPKFRKCQCIERTKKGCCNSVEQCPHIHFKADVVDRDQLGHNDHLNLLCTSKGYRWPPFIAPSGEDGEEEENAGLMGRGVGKRVICHGQKVRKADRQYVHNFLAEVWALLTPEMITRLKEMLQNEFKMTPEIAGRIEFGSATTNQSDFIDIFLDELLPVNPPVASMAQAMQIIHCYDNVFREASEFILEQKAKSIPVVEEAPKKVKGFVVRRGRKCAGIRHYYSTQFNRIVSAKVTDYLVATLSSRRTKNQRKISEFLLKNLNDVTGEKFTLQYPKSLSHKIMVFLTDRVSGWLADRVSEAEELLKEDQEIEQLKAEKKKREKEKNKKQGNSSDKKGGNQLKKPTNKSNQSLSKEDSKKAEENPTDGSDQPEAPNLPEDAEAEN